MSRLNSNLRLVVSLLYIAAFYAPEIGFGREPLDLAAFLLSVTCRVIDGIIRSRPMRAGNDHSNEPGAKKQSSQEFYWFVYQYQTEAQGPIGVWRLWPYPRQ